MLKNPIETPYTPEGREAYRQRTGKFRPNARDDPAMSLTLSEVVAKGLTDKKYNFEYVMNRAYAYNRDRGKCRVCGEYIYPADLHVHHQRPYLPLDQVNKVGELVSLAQTLPRTGSQPRRFEREIACKGLETDRQTEGKARTLSPDVSMERRVR